MRALQATRAGGAADAADPPRGPTFAGAALVAEIALFALAFALRLLYLRELVGTPYYGELGPISDSGYYHARAQEIAAGQFVGSEASFLSPLYCYFLGAIYALAGPDPVAARVVQCALGGVSCVVLRRIGRRFFSDAVGWLGALVLCFYGLHVYYATIVLPTVLVVFVSLLVLWSLAALRDRPAWGPGLVTGVLIGLAALAKSNALLLLPMAGLWLWLLPRQAPRAARAGATLCLGVGAALSIAPITLNNYRATGEFVLITTTGGRNFYKGNGPYATGTHAFLPPGEKGVNLAMYLKDRVDPLEAVRDSSELSAETWRHVREHPGRAAALLVRKFVMFFNAFELLSRDQFYFALDHSRVLKLAPFTFGLIAPLGLAGLVMSWRRWRPLSLFHGFFAVQVASFVLVFVLARYRLVAVACLALLAAQQLLWWRDGLRERRWAALAGSLGVLLVAGGFVHRPLDGFSRSQGFADQHQDLGRFALEHGDPQRALVELRRSLESEWLNELNVVPRRWRSLLLIAKAERALGHSRAAERTLAKLLVEIDTRKRSVEVRKDLYVESEAREMLEEIRGAGP